MVDIPITNIQAPHSNTQGRASYVPQQAIRSSTAASVEKTEEKTQIPVAALPKNLQDGQKIDIFVVRDNVFSLYKLPNGELFTKIQDLRTGEEQIYPLLDSLSFYEALRGNKGIIIEQDV